MRLRKATSVAIQAAVKAGELLSWLSRQPIQYRMKNRFDILAEADTKSEKLIIKYIRRAFPTHRILAEESGESAHCSPFLWVVDPLDGTINYSRGIGEYAVSIALEIRGRLEVGVIYEPAAKNLYVAERHRGAYRNGKRMRVSPENSLVNTLIAVDNSSNPPARRRTFKGLSRVVQKVRHVRLFGSGALHMAKIAAGEIDGYFKARSNYWDYAAGTLLVHEAGGRVSDYRGSEFRKDSTDIVAGNGKINNQLLRLLSRRSRE